MLLIVAAAWGTMASVLCCSGAVSWWFTEKYEKDRLAFEKSVMREQDRLRRREAHQTALIFACMEK